MGTKIKGSGPHAELVLERADVELSADAIVGSPVGALEVEHELFALGEDGHQAAAGGVVLGVLLEMGSELQDAGRETGNLVVRAAAVVIGLLEVWDLAEVSSLSAIASAAI